MTEIALVVVTAFFLAFSAVVVVAVLRLIPRVTRSQVYAMVHQIHMSQAAATRSAAKGDQLAHQAHVGLSEVEGGPSDLDPLYERPGEVDDDLWDLAMEISEQENIPPVLALSNLQEASRRDGLPLRT